MRRLAILVALSMGALASHAGAGTISLSGDLGTGTWPMPTTIFINTTWTEPFLRVVPGRGLLQGDVVSTNNNGNFFSLVLTNLTFQANAPTPFGGLTHVKIDVLQGFQVATPNATYTASHFVGGNWSTGTGNAIFCDSIQGFFGPNQVSLPSLVFVNTFGSPSFGVPLASATVSNSSATLYGIRSTFDLFIDGDGFIDLPSSYHGSATEVPAPGALALLGLAGLVTARRRR